MIASINADRMNPLFLRCLQGARGPASCGDTLVKDAAKLNERDWLQFYELATYHQVRPLVHARLKELGLVQFLPAAIAQRLAHEQRLALAQNLGLLRQLAEVAAVLESADIPVIVLKGPLLACQVYQHVSHRPMRDLDIMV